MSQSGRPSYQRSAVGLFGALVVVVAVVLGWSLFRAVTSDKPNVPVRTVDWSTWVESAHQDGKLALTVPTELPSGWRATSAKYDSGMAPQLRIGMLTPDQQFVGFIQARTQLGDLVHANVDEHAKPGADVTIDGTTWQTWSDSGGDYAVGHVIEHEGGADAVLVYGSAPKQQIHDFAASLRPVG